MPPPYLPPDFATLYNEAIQFEKRFYQLPIFFKLVSKKNLGEIMSRAELQEELVSLRAKYDAEVTQVESNSTWAGWGFRKLGSITSSVTSTLTGYGTDRPAQIKAITDLIPLFPNPGSIGASKDSEAKKKEEDAEKQRIYILLGALSYRLSRFSMNEYASLEIALAKSAFCSAIYKILDPSANNKLDDWTVMTSCQFFYDFIDQNREALEIPYIKEDPQFYTKLKTIITNYTVKAQPIIDQLAYISLIQSVAEVIQKLYTKLFPVLNELERIKVKPVFDSPQKMLDYFVKKIGFLPYEHKYLGQIIHEVFSEYSADEPEYMVTNLIDKIAMRNEFTLLGAYLFALIRCSEGSWPNKKVQQDKAMLHGMLEGVILAQDTHSLDYATRNAGLKYLLEFVDLPGIAQLVDPGAQRTAESAQTYPINLHYWRLITNLTGAIDTEIVAIEPFLKEEREQREAEEALAKQKARVALAKQGFLKEVTVADVDKDDEVDEQLEDGDKTPVPSS